MRTWWGYAVLIGLIGCACGCGDSPRVMVRDAQTLRNELVDAMLKVSDEETAQTVLKEEVEKKDVGIKDRWAKLKKDRLDDYQTSGKVTNIRSMEKTLKNSLEASATKNKANMRIKEAADEAAEKRGLVARADLDTLGETALEYFSAQEAVLTMADEIEATSHRMKKQVERLKKLVDQLAQRKPGDRRKNFPSLMSMLDAPEDMATYESYQNDGKWAWDAPLRFITVKLKIDWMRQQPRPAPAQ
jgi:hypothetical protein